MHPRQQSLPSRTSLYSLTRSINTGSIIPYVSVLIMPIVNHYPRRVPFLPSLHPISIILPISCPLNRCLVRYDQFIPIIIPHSAFVFMPPDIKPSSSSNSLLSMNETNGNSSAQNDSNQLQVSIYINIFSTCLQNRVLNVSAQKAVTFFDAIEKKIKKNSRLNCQFHVCPLQPPRHDYSTSSSSDLQWTPTTYSFPVFNPPLQVPATYATDTNNQREISDTYVFGTSFSYSLLFTFTTTDVACTTKTKKFHISLCFHEHQRHYLVKVIGYRSQLSDVYAPISSSSSSTHQSCSVSASTPHSNYDLPNEGKSNQSEYHLQFRFSLIQSQ